MLGSNPTQGQLSVANFKNPLVVNYICISLFRYTHDYLRKISIEMNMVTKAIAEMESEH